MQHIMANEFKQKLAQSQDFIILDVRHEYEHDVSKIPGSILIPLDQLESRLSELEAYRDKNLVVYCKAGARSCVACSILENNGFKHVYNLGDGIIGWLET